MSELLPCPMCGGEAKAYHRINANTVTCQSCGLKVHQSEMGQGDAAECWNRRHVPGGFQRVSMKQTETMSKRQLGWYWIRFNPGERWEIAEWDGIGWGGMDWCIIYYDPKRPEATPDEIGPRIPTPDEPWQTVPNEANADMMDVLTLGNHVTAGRRWRDTLAVAPEPGGRNEP